MTVSIDHSNERWIECEIATDGGAVRSRFTTRAAGDFAVRPIDGDTAALSARRHLVCPWPVVWLHQMHSSDVHLVTTTNTVVGSKGDAMFTADERVGLCVQTADCVPVVVVTQSGSFAVIHAGWRGAALGVIERAVRYLKADTNGHVAAVIGPCISAERYEFGVADLTTMAGYFGPSIQGQTEWGAPSLDMRHVARIALERAGVTDIHDIKLCTAGDQRFFSHRARGDTGRMMLAAWREAPMAPTGERLGE